MDLHLANNEENDETILKLGEAIRSGNVENVANIISANSVRIDSILNSLGIMFETCLRRKDDYKEEETKGH